MWHINCLEMLAVFHALRHFLPDLRGHHVLFRIWSPTSTSRGVCVRATYTGAPPTQTCLHPWASDSGSRYPVETGAEARVMEAPSRGGGAPLERVWPGESGSICAAGNNTLSTLILSFASSFTWAGCHSSQGFVCTLPPDCSVSPKQQAKS